MTPSTPNEGSVRDAVRLNCIELHNGHCSSPPALAAQPAPTSEGV